MSRLEVPDIEEQDYNGVSDDNVKDNWENLGLRSDIVSALLKNDFKYPTVVQNTVIPHALRDRRDIVGSAETGSGKTLAFGLPVIQSLVDLSEVEEEEETKQMRIDVSNGDAPVSPFALIIAPTRELAKQIITHLRAVSDLLPSISSSLKIINLIGGLSVQKQERLLKCNPQIVVATPGRLWQFLSESELVIDLSSLNFLIVDEADRIVSDGHFKEFNLLMNRIKEDEEKASIIEGDSGEGEEDGSGSGSGTDSDSNSNSNSNSNPINKFVSRRQTLLFSATIPSSTRTEHKVPLSQSRSYKAIKRAKRLSATSPLDRLIASIPFTSPQKPKVISLAPSDGIASSLTQFKVLVPSDEKDFILAYALMNPNAPDKVIVFCNSVDSIRRLSSIFGEILKAMGGVCFILHSSMAQRARLSTFDAFSKPGSSAALRVLFATDVAARGLDIPSVPLIVHYQFPRSRELYIHRSGRSGRAFTSGASLLLVDSSEAHKAKSKQSVDLSNCTEFPIDWSLMDGVRERVRIAREIDALTHKTRKTRAEKNWVTKAADVLEIDLESEPRSKFDIDDLAVSEDTRDREMSEENRNLLLSLRTSLEQVCRMPLIAVLGGKKYFTGMANANELVAKVVEGKVGRTNTPRPPPTLHERKNKKAKREREGEGGKKRTK